MSDINNICMKCMSKLENKDKCQKCGEKIGAPQNLPFLPKKTIIGSRYAVGCGLEMNGEGLSYIGYDTVKDSKVYIREFFPANICSRGSNIKNVIVSSYRKCIYERELNKFLKYFRSVARLRNIPAICAVFDIFNENGTAYVIIEWIDGKSLDKFIHERGGHITWDEAKSMIIPFISSLNDMNKSGVLHLGISPSNIFIMDNKKIKLSGFAIHDLRNLNSPIDAQLYDGCSALEQYIEIYETDGSTDVYGLTASLFFALTGEYPQTATKRKKDDRLFIAKNIVKSIPDNVISGIAGGLRVYPNNRTLSFERLKIELSDSPIAQISRSQGKNPEIKKYKNDKQKNKNFIWGITSCGIALITLIAGFIVYWFGFKNNHQGSSSDDISSEQQNFEENLNETTKNKIKVPDLIGKKFSDIKSQDAASAGYEVLLLSEEFNEGTSEGNIISQTPNAGKEMYEGAIIAVNVSKGNKMRQLPHISGKTISEASLAISGIGIKPIESWKNNNNVPEGYIIGYSDKNEGDLVEYGSEVIIVRSLGAIKR